MGKLTSLSLYCLIAVALIASMHLIVSGYATLSSTIIRSLLDHTSRHTPLPPYTTSSAALPQPRPPAPPEARGECEPLTKQLATSVSAGNSLGIVFVTFCNTAQVDFALNWMAQLERLELGESGLIGATDVGAAQVLLAAGKRCFSLASSIGMEEAKWGSPGFAQMGRTKAALVATFLRFNLTLFFADADVVFLRNPISYVEAALATGAQLLFHTDAFGASPSALASSAPFNSSSGDNSQLEDPHFVRGAEFNTGLFLMTAACAPLASAWQQALTSDKAFANWMNDQQALNKLLLRGAVYASASVNSPLLVFDGSLRLGVLPSHLFPSGHVFFIQRLNANLGQRPIAVHLTFQNCDQSGKRHRMREAQLWLVDSPSYYSPPGGLLSYDVDLPPHLTRGVAPVHRRNLRASDEVLASHFALMNHQLVQLRTALALSIALNRTLVLPRMLCGLETVTNFAHSGVRCTDCEMKLPYWCPADHVLRMHYLAGVMPQRMIIPLRLREHSLLLNPAAPPLDPWDRVHITAQGERTRRCEHCGPHNYMPEDDAAAAAAQKASAAGVGVWGHVPTGQAAHQVVLSSNSLTEEELVRELAQFASRRVLHFDLSRAKGFSFELEAAGRRRDFEETLKPLGGGWCCAEPEKRGGVGHYWYDLLHDRAHKDRFGRTWTREQPWRPTPGP